jgi:hypothetical protein
MRWSAQQHQHKTPHQSPLVTASPQGEALGAATPESVNNNLSFYIVLKKAAPVTGRLLP